MEKMIGISCSIFDNKPFYVIHYSGGKAKELTYEEFMEKIEKIRRFQELEEQNETK